MAQKLLEIAIMLSAAVAAVANAYAIYIHW